MGANRKLQTEIDRTLKRVSEGIETFDQVWEKVRRMLRGFCVRGLAAVRHGCRLAFRASLTWTEC